MAAIKYLFDNNFISFIWEQKIIILGGIFFGLAIYKYFYRSIKLYKASGRINEIERLIMAKKQESNDLEHEILDMKIKRIANDMDLNLRAFRAEIRAEFEVINLRFDGFDSFAKKATVEIKQLKDDTAFVRDAKKWKWVVGLALVGLITTVNFSKIQEWISKILPW